MLPMPHYVNKRESNLCQYKYDNNVDNHNIAKKKGALLEKVVFKGERGVAHL